MRTLLLIIAGILLSVSGISQTVNYRITEDNPEKVLSHFINLEPIVMDVTLGHVDGSSLGIGANTYWHLSDNMALNGLIRAQYFHMAPSSNMGIWFEGGADYFLSNKTKQSEIPIILAYSSQTIGSTTTTTSSFIKVPGKVKNRFGLRGGTFLKTGYYDKGGLDDQSAATTLGGVYLGGFWAQSYFIKTILNKNNYEGVTSLLFNTYFDFLITPLAKVDGDIALIDDPVGNKTGWRFGYQYYLNPNDRKENHDPNLFTNFNFRVEVGKRPIDGFNILATAAWTIYKI